MSREQATAALLDWYSAMGADEAIAEMPLDAFAVSAQRAARAEAAPKPPLNRSFSEDADSDFGGQIPDFSPRRPQKNPPQPVTPPVRPKPADAANALPAEEIAKAKTLAELETLVAGFDGCPLKRTAKNLCFSRGSETAKLMLIGEAPGRDEDLQGKPFVGRAGQLLDKMLSAIGLDEDSVYITNTVYWRPPGNRTPTPQEIASCMPFLERQIALLQPKAMMLLGGAAASSVLKTSQGIMRLRGKWKTFEDAGDAVPVMATLHPAYLLRNPAAKAKAWQDLLMVKQRLTES